MNKVAVIYSNYYKDVVDGLLDGIKTSINESFTLEYFKVPGSWDIVYKTNSLSNEFKIFIAVGVICKGDTDHYEYISNSVANGLLNLTINTLPDFAFISPKAFSSFRAIESINGCLIARSK